MLRQIAVFLISIFLLFFTTNFSYLSENNTYKEMSDFAKFEPIVPSINEEAIKYYRDNNLALPSNLFFNDYFNVTPTPEPDNFFVREMKESHPLRNLTRVKNTKKDVEIPLTSTNTELPNLTINIGAKNSIADRHNNPGNLIYVGQKGAKKGEKKGSAHWAMFDTPLAGFMALVDDIKAKQSGKTKTGLTGESTISDFINVYAPAHENDTSGYINSILKSMKIDSDTTINRLNPIELAKVIARIESSTKIT